MGLGVWRQADVHSESVEWDEVRSVDDVRVQIGVRTVQFCFRDGHERFEARIWRLVNDEAVLSGGHSQRVFALTIRQRFQVRPPCSSIAATATSGKSGAPVGVRWPGGSSPRQRTRHSFLPLLFLLSRVHGMGCGGHAARSTPHVTSPQSRTRFGPGRGRSGRGIDGGSSFSLCALLVLVICAVVCGLAAAGRTANSKQNRVPSPEIRW